GQFDWKSLRAYAEAEEGRCNNAFCKVPGSTADRHISFFPVQKNLMALAVSTDDSAAWRLSEAARRQPEGPARPGWISIPAPMLQSNDKFSTNLPPGAAIFARALTSADSVTLALVPDTQQFAVRLSVRCKNAEDAATITNELTKATTVLQQIIQHEHQTA